MRGRTNWRHAGRSRAGWVRDISSRISIHNTFFTDIAEFNRNRFADLLIPIVKLKWDALTADRRSLKTKENPICRALYSRSGSAPVATLNFSKRTWEVVGNNASHKKTNPRRVYIKLERVPLLTPQ